MKYKCTDLISRWYDECKTITIQIPKQSFGPGFVNYKKGALDSQPQVIKFTSCLFMVGGSLRVLPLLRQLKLVAMI